VTLIVTVLRRAGSRLPKDVAWVAVARASAIATALIAAGCGQQPELPADVALAQAEETLAAGHAPLAIALVSQAVRAQPDDPAVRRRAAELYFEVGAAHYAETHAARALSLGAGPASVLPVLARAYRAQGRFDKLAAIEIPPAVPPDVTAVVLSIQADGALAQGRMDAAERLLQDASRLAPEAEAVGITRARLLLAAGERGTAETLLQEIRARYPNSADAAAMLADIVRDRGGLREAEALYSAALAQSGFKMPLHFLRGEVRLDLGDLAGAEEDTLALEAAVPDAFAAHYLRGRVMLLKADPAAALAELEAASEARPSHVGALLYGGVAAQVVGRTNLAEDWLRRVVKEAPGNVPANLVLAVIRIDQQRYADAERHLRALPRVMPGNPLPRRLLAAALIAQDKAAEAIPLLSELVVARPDDARSQLDLSVALVLSGAKSRGVAALDGLLARHPDYRPAHEYLIAFHVREQQWADAERWSESLVSRYPGDAQALYLKAEVLRQAGRTDAAVEVLRQVLEIDPGHVDANMRLADVALSAGDAEVAQRHYASILSARPDNLDALLGQARVAAADGRPDDAEAALATSIGAHPGALAPRVLLARKLLGRRDPQRAVAVLQDDAPAAFRSDAAYLQLLAEALLAAGTPQLAADAARELVALRPDRIEAYGLYARILTALDDKIALEETLQQMLTIDPAHVPTRLELVRLQIATGRFEVAERLLSPLLANLDRPPLADLLYGLILTATGRPAQAVASLKHAHDVMSSQRTLLALANAEAQARSLDDAIARQRAWLEEHPADVEVHVNLAGHLVQAEYVSEALAEYERALALNPEHLVALNNLAWYSLEMDPRRATELAAQALDAHPESLEAAHTLVSAQVEGGEWRGAELTLDRALARYPTDTGLLWLSALVLHQKGQAQYALQRLERLLEAELAAPERERARALLVQIEDEVRAEQAKVSW
jgi:putative PEP-CTERM system TPR-repeat lipoprotein